MKKSLYDKYNVPVPRYTSYPTVPNWSFDDKLKDQWLNVVKRTFDETNEDHGISLYIHLPFCESLCTYCGCSQHITINHAVEKRYIECVLKEWKEYLKVFDEKPIIRAIHLGGGTPTFFSSENLEWLISSVLDGAIIHSEKEFSFEGHPNNTTAEHLRVLAALGFDRVSFGVQDFELKIQKAINRVQPYENVEAAILQARQNNYASVNFDLVYGLPFQTPDIVKRTFKKVLALRPDRIAYYSYAHVPWKRPGQRAYSESDLPTHEEKRVLYDVGRVALLAAGYKEIGMDHFALPHDELYKAMERGELHRNFMGYTVSNTELLLGLGASSISDAKYAFAQNVKKVKVYQDAVVQGTDRLINGHLLNTVDLKTGQLIRELIGHGRVKLDDYYTQLPEALVARLSEFLQDGMIDISNDELAVTTLGKPFIRNICQAFDDYELNRKKEKTIYSQSI